MAAYSQKKCPDTSAIHYWYHCSTLVPGMRALPSVNTRWQGWESILEVGCHTGSAVSLQGLNPQPIGHLMQLSPFIHTWNGNNNSIYWVKITDIFWKFRIYLRYLQTSDTCFKYYRKKWKKGKWWWWGTDKTNMANVNMLIMVENRWWGLLCSLFYFLSLKLYIIKSHILFT
jgi:hypothetical protein